MTYHKASVIRIRLNISECYALLEMLDITQPNYLSDFNGERHGLSTLRNKLTPIVNDLKALREKDVLANKVLKAPSDVKAESATKGAMSTEYYTFIKR